MMEDAGSGQLIVDMSVRTPGSLRVGVLKGHFLTDHGLHMLSGIRHTYNIPRDLSHAI